MRILISGVTSLLGLSVAKRLVASGHTVYGIVRENSKNREKVEGEKGITLLSLDMSEMEEEEKAKALSSIAFDMVFHFAWDGVGSAGRSDAVMQEKNLRMSKAFFHWAKEETGLFLLRFRASWRDALCGSPHLFHLWKRRP